MSRSRTGNLALISRPNTATTLQVTFESGQSSASATGTMYLNYDPGPSGSGLASTATVEAYGGSSSSVTSPQMSF